MIARRHTTLFVSISVRRQPSTSQQNLGSMYKISIALPSHDDFQVIILLLLADLPSHNSFAALRSFAELLHPSRHLRLVLLCRRVCCYALSRRCGTIGSRSGSCCACTKYSAFISDFVGLIVRKRSRLSPAWRMLEVTVGCKYVRVSAKQDT